MRTFIFIVLSLLAFNLDVKAQKKRDTTFTHIPNSIYFSSFEQKYAETQVSSKKLELPFNFKFLQFDEDRIASNLSNSLYFGAFGKKPSKYYLDTYKKLYDLKGQRAAFFNIEKLYEVPQRPDTTHNK